MKTREGGFITLTPICNPPLNFPGQHQNHFFYFDRPMPPLETTTNVRVLHMLHNGARWSQRRSYWKWRPGQDVKVAPTERVARAFTGGVLELASGPLSFQRLLRWRPGHILPFILPYLCHSEKCSPTESSYGGVADGGSCLGALN